MSGKELAGAYNLRHLFVRKPFEISQHNNNLAIGQKKEVLLLPNLEPYNGGSSARRSWPRSKRYEVNSATALSESQ